MVARTGQKETKMVTYRVTFIKTPEEGSLAGMHLNGKIDCSTWSDAMRYVRGMLKNPRHQDVLGNIALWTKVELWSVWPDGSTIQETI